MHVRMVATVMATVLCQTAAAAQTDGVAVRGRVRDATTQQPIASAVVQIVEPKRTSSTDVSGAFTLASLPPGSYEIEISAPGYTTLKAATVVRAADVQSLDVQLAPNPRHEEELVVTASGRAESPGDLVQSVGHIGRDELARARGVGLDETLNTIPGIRADSQAATQEVRISIRGRGARASFGVSGIRVLVDGIPETDATGETSDLTGIDPAALDRIEAVKGPMAAQYGASSSGVVNVTTPRGGSVPTIDLRESLGSYGFNKTQGLFSGGVSNTIRYFASLSKTGQDGYREHSRLDSHLFSTRVDLRMSDTFSLATFVRRTSVDSQLPGNLSKDDMNADRRAASFFFTAFDAESNIDRLQVGGTAAKRFAHGGALTLTAFTGQADFDVAVPFIVLQGHRIMSGGGTRYFYDRAIAGRPHTMSVGVDLQRTTEDRDDLENNFGGIRGPGVARDEDRAISSVSASFLDTLALSDRLALRGGLNFTTVTIGIDDFLHEDGDGTGEQRFSRTSVLIGARYRVTDRLSGYGHVSTGFDPPTISAIGRDPAGGGGLNDALKPERSTNVEGGLQLRMGDVATLSAAAFHLRMSDEIVPAGTGTPQETFINAARTTHNGLELSWHGSLTSELSVRAAYALSRFRYREFVSRVGDVAGNALPGIPVHRGTLSVSYAGRTGLTAGASWLGNGRMFADDANVHDNPSYQVTNLYAGYSRALQRLRLTVLYRLSNAFDEQYVSYLVVNDRFNGFYYPSPERNHSVLLQAGWRF